MKPEQIFQELIQLAEKMEITVKVQNLRKAGIHVESGLCKVKNEWVYILDKHKSMRDKIDLLLECLAPKEHENIYVVPAIREMLNKEKEKLAKKAMATVVDEKGIEKAEHPNNKEDLSTAT